MSKYTTEVRYICETSAGLTSSQGADSVDTILENCYSKVFNFDFPIFDETYRKVLEKKILKHYYTREIGEETVGLWKLRLNTRLNEIMPYYNKMYISETYEFNPLYNRNLERTTTTNGTVKTNGTQNGTSTDTSTSTVEHTSETEGTSTTNGTNKYSDTPQGSISNLSSDTYLTNATIDNETGSNTSNTNASNTTNTNATISSNASNNSTVDSTDSYVEYVKGFEGTTGSKLIKEYRDILLNIDMMVIGELEDLFFQLW